MERTLWFLNGRFLPASEAALPLDDLGFVWGAIVVDRLRTFRQKLFRLDDHLRRFRQSCERACILQPRTDSELSGIAHQLIETNAKQVGPDHELSLVIFATPGVPGGEPTIGMQATPLDFARYAPLLQNGARLEPVAIASSLDPVIKHRSRLAWWITKQQASVGSEPLFTTDKPAQFIRETPIANFLAVIEGSVVSPPRSTVLNGISLQVVEELTASLGIAFAEREISLAEALERSSECLLTSTSYCLAPVASLAGKEKLLEGPIFRRLLQAWSDLAGVNILLQILTNR